MKKRRSRRISAPKKSNLPKKYDSELEEKFHKKWKTDFPLIPLITQHRFHPVREWRFDFCHLSSKIAVEIQGYGEGHTSYESMKKDYEKHNEAILLGWRLVYLMSYQIEENKTHDNLYLLITGTTNVRSKIQKGHGPIYNSVEQARRHFDTGTDS